MCGQFTVQGHLTHSIHEITRELCDFIHLQALQVKLEERQIQKKTYPKAETKKKHILKRKLTKPNTGKRKGRKEIAMDT